MENLRELLEKHLNKEVHQLILSGARNSDGPSKVKIRPILLSDRLMYQASATVGKKEIHKNYEKEEVIDYIEEMLKGHFKQMQVTGSRQDASVLVSKKGKMTIKEKKHPENICQKTLEHNRKKRYILEEGIVVPFLVDLGVMTKEGKIVHARYDKFRQINRFLEFIEDILPQLDKGRKLTILDFGCGKSYLTFAMYYYLCKLKKYDVQIVGLDLKEDVIAHCESLARAYGYEGLHFCQGNIASYEGVDQVDMVVTLHACDTATDYALAKAVEWGAKVILSVPCCQHELNGQISNEMLQPILSYGILKERMAALVTDAVRAELLKEQGYQVQILEFIDMEHTPKNLLIRAVKDGKKQMNPQLRRCISELHIHPTLAALLQKQEGQVEENSN